MSNDRFAVHEIGMNELDEAVSLHQHLLSDEFIVRLGPQFLRQYYRVFSSSPYALALVAVDETSHKVLGALLGTTNPPLHYQFFTRRHGAKFAALVLIRAVTHPPLAIELIRTRTKRYVLGVIRSLLRRTQPADAPPATSGTTSTASNAAAVGDVTHLFVNESAQVNGIGSALMQAYTTHAKAAGVHRVDLVTALPENGGVGPFYEKLGWTQAGKVVSPSGEEFLLYQKHLK